MEIEHIVILLICGLGVLHGFILGLFLLLKLKSESLSNIILGVLLLLFGLRISKSIFLYFTSDLDYMLITLGLTLLLLLGPLFYFYTRAYLDNNFKFKVKSVVHAIPFLVLLVLNSFELLSKEFYLTFGIYAVYAHFLGYIVASFVWKEKYIKGHDVNPIKKQWLKYTHVGILFIWASYFIFLLGDFVPYILGPITYSVAIYSLSFWAITHKAIAKEDVKYQNSSLNNERSHEIFKSLETYFNRDKVFLDPNLKLSAVAKKLNVTPHALSQVVNENYNHNFQYYLNSFRIEEAKLKLASETSKNVTISSIAYDCGFNSISAFNTAFKKLENQTPSQFRGMNRS